MTTNLRAKEQFYCLTVMEGTSLKWVLVGLSQGIGSAVLHLETLRRIYFLVFPESRCCPCSLALDPSSIFKGNSVVPLNLSVTDLLSLPYKDPWDYFGFTWIAQDNLPISGSLIECYWQSLPYKAACSQTLRIRTWISSLGQWIGILCCFLEFPPQETYHPQWW